MMAGEVVPIRKPIEVQVRRMDKKWEMLEAIEQAARQAESEGRALDVVWLSQQRDGSEYERGRFRILEASCRVS